ncbi:MAG: DUF5696 domain-containing protein [Candidatus Omnitrophota bacterium]
MKCSYIGRLAGLWRWLAVIVLVLLVGFEKTSLSAHELIRLESSSVLVKIDPEKGAWSLLDKKSNAAWPSEGTAEPGWFKDTELEFIQVKHSAKMARLTSRNDFSVTFNLIHSGRTLEIHYDGQNRDEIHVMKDALTVADSEDGNIIVPCREGLLIPANSGVAFKKTFGTSEYEGCHMNMLGFLKSGSALVLTWDGAYVWPDIESVVQEGPAPRQQLTTELRLRETARVVRLTPLGKGDWNTIAAAYRRIAERKGLAVTLRDKVRRDTHAERLVGAANVKLWMCLARRMNEESTKEESVEVHWTFDEAADVAEHLRNDLGITRCLFTLGGWTEGGYDVRHPDDLPANPECGGNDALAGAIQRVQKLGYVASLHDNYQDMYQDAKSWNPAYIEKRADGSLIQGGRWMGGRAYMVCAPKQVELAMRPQNLPSIHKLFEPWSYFIDTTYAVGPRECADPNHRIDRNEDIAWKIQLSNNARKIFGLFGSECGREWALPCSDFFEGLVGVAGNYFHQLKPESLGARVIPFWEMVYHDCQICYGKYGYSAEESAEYVAHHILTARPLHYHSIPDHLYWKEKSINNDPSGDRACFTRTDNGWAEGFHPTDVFLKNTHEILGPLHQATAYQRLIHLEWLTPDGALRQAVYGKGRKSARVAVNFGAKEVEIQSQWGGEVLLPPWGFIIESPGYAAFYANRWNGMNYPDGSLFTIQAQAGKNLQSTGSVRIFHAFGDPKITWKNTTYTVRREEVIHSPS